MNVQTLLEQLDQSGVTLKADGHKLLVAPRGLLTPEVRDVLRQRKAEILAPLKKPMMPQPDALVDLLQTPIRHLTVPLAVESSVLGETIYLVASDHQTATIRAGGGIPYTPEEIDLLWELRQVVTPEVWGERLRLIHTAKQKFEGRIIPEGV